MHLKKININTYFSKYLCSSKKVLYKFYLFLINILITCKLKSLVNFDSVMFSESPFLSTNIILSPIPVEVRISS